MPTYEYKCKKCGNQFEIAHGFNEKAQKCPKCKSKRLERVVTSFTFIRK